MVSDIFGLHSHHLSQQGMAAEVEWKRHVKDTPLKWFHLEYIFGIEEMRVVALMVGLLGGV